MSTDHLKLLLAELEVEVVQEALELYLQMRREPVDRRFEYRYRAWRGRCSRLRRGSEFGTISHRDNDEETVVDNQRSERRPLREQVED